MSVFESRQTFKPFKYSWAYELWLEHEQMHWISREVPLHEDVRDWRSKLTEDDRNFLTNVFLLFTQSDVDVAGGYINDYLPYFPQPELRMMLLGFASRETIHIDAYSHLIETLGMPEAFYAEFLDIPVMREKHDFFNKVISTDTSRASLPSLPLKIAGISAFTEGMFLFSSFIMLLNYPRNGLMKGMGQIISWSVLDEQQHVKGLIKLFRTIIQENPKIWNDGLKGEIYSTATMMSELEFEFIDYVFARMKDVDSKQHKLTAKDLKTYVKYIVDRRLFAMGLKGIHNVVKNPLPWVDEIISSQNHENFFENRATSYAKGALKGSWDNVWGVYK
jgi:ribonucleoside-diphosphate reductase beta chain